MNIPSRQEMLDRAVRGLRGQGFERSICHDDFGDHCVYDDGQGRKCAWGHVDPELTSSQWRTVGALRASGIGIAARLSSADFDFATCLQIAHDAPKTPEGVVSLLRELARDYNLTYPEPLDGEPKDPS